MSAPLADNKMLLRYLAILVVPVLTVSIFKELHGSCKFYEPNPNIGFAGKIDSVWSTEFWLKPLLKLALFSPVFIYFLYKIRTHLILPLTLGMYFGLSTFDTWISPQHRDWDEYHLYAQMDTIFFSVLVGGIVYSLEEALKRRSRNNQILSDVVDEH